LADLKWGPARIAFLFLSPAMNAWLVAGSVTLTSPLSLLRTVEKPNSGAEFEAAAAFTPSPFIPRERAG
jgi:hypothetical protein